jgi:pilus assembly protein CpaB
MKKYGTLIALAVAVIFGILAVVLANKWLSTRAQEQVAVREQVPLTQVVIAARDLDIGTRLTEQNLVLADWPKANAPKGAFSRVEDVIGRVTVTKMVAGKPLVAAELAAEGSGVGLVAQIRPGYRAMSIRVDEVIGVGGFILPSTFVDVIAVEEQSSKKMVGKTILERIQVLAVAQETFVEEGKAQLVRTVTLELSQRQAEILAAQVNQNPIHLVLRNPTDLNEKVVEVEEKPVARQPVVRRAPTPAPTSQPSSAFTIEVIQGDKKAETYKF